MSTALQLHSAVLLFASADSEARSASVQIMNGILPVLLAAHAPLRRCSVAMDKLATHATPRWCADRPTTLATWRRRLMTEAWTRCARASV